MIQQETKDNLYKEIKSLVNDIDNVNKNNARSLKEKCDANDEAENYLKSKQNQQKSDFSEMKFKLEEETRTVEREG